MGKVLVQVVVAPLEALLEARLSEAGVAAGRGEGSPACNAPHPTPGSLPGVPGVLQSQPPPSNASGHRDRHLPGSPQRPARAGLLLGDVGDVHPAVAEGVPREGLRVEPHGAPVRAGWEDPGTGGPPHPRGTPPLPTQHRPKNRLTLKKWERESNPPPQPTPPWRSSGFPFNPGHGGRARSKARYKRLASTPAPPTCGTAAAAGWAGWPSAKRGGGQVTFQCPQKQQMVARSHKLRRHKCHPKE